MPNIKSQVDRAKQSKKENLHNKAIKSALRTTIKKAENAIEGMKAGYESIDEYWKKQKTYPTYQASKETIDKLWKDVAKVEQEPLTAVKDAEIALHKAASKGVITRKTASRKTSRLNRRLNTIRHELRSSHEEKIAKALAEIAKHQNQ